MVRKIKQVFDDAERAGQPIQPYHWLMASVAVSLGVMVFWLLWVMGGY